MSNMTVSNTTPKAIIDACRWSDTQISSLLSDVKISEDSLKKSGGRIGFSEVIRLWELSYVYTQDRMIGIKTAQQLPFGAFKAIDYMMATSETAKRGLSKALEYYPLINEGFDLFMTTRGGNCYVELHNPTDPKILPFQYVDFVLACVLSRIRYSTATDWVPSEVHLTCREPKDIDGYHEFFQSPICFNRSVNRLVFENKTLNNPLPHSDPVLCEMLYNHAQSLVNRLPSDLNLLQELSKILRQNLQSGNIDLNSCAREMRMSRRSLQRKLKSKGVSYRELFTKIRFELATDLLSQSDMSLEETAFLVGYSEKSSFYRAFKKWTGKSPQKISDH